MNIDSLKNLLQYTVSNHRYQHSLGVADTALALALRFNVNEEYAYIAGLTHDIYREISLDEQIGLARTYCLLEPNGISFPMVLHGRLAKLALQQHFNYANSTVNQAMAHHTGCGRKMSNLDKIVFIADSFEPNRNFVSPAILEKLRTASIDSLFFFALTVNIKLLQDKNVPIYPETLKWFSLMKDLRTKK